MSKETAILNPQGGVMFFNGQEWKAMDGGLSTIWVLENQDNGTFRLVTRDESTNTFTVNQVVQSGIIFSRATETFVQWRQDDLNYGINFATEDDAIALEQLFSEVVEGAKKFKRMSSKPRRAKKKKETSGEEPPPQPLTPEEEAERKRIELRNRAANEIYTSEESYVKSLKQLQEIWIEPMKQKGLIQENDYQSLFKNIEQIIQVNEEILNEFKDRIDSWSQTQKIGDIFVRNAKILKIYKIYCENYDNSIEHIKLLSKKRNFAAFVKATEAKSEGLSFYLIMPVQRIPRYQLLLKELLSKTTEDHPDFQFIQDALVEIKNLAGDVNQGVAKAVKHKKLQEVISRNFQGLSPLLLAHRALILDGEVDCNFAHGKSNYALLFNDIFVFATETTKLRQVNMHIELNHTWAIDIPEMGDLSFQLVTPETTISVTAKDKKTKDAWYTEIEKATNEWLTQKDLYKDGQEGIDACERVRITEYNFDEGSIYRGEWFKGKMQGKGVYTSNNGSKFEGNFVKGFLHGYGTAKYRTGEIYEGEWARDLPHGKGKLTSTTEIGTRYYDGEWENGKKKGLGIMVWENGDKYEGTWDSDRFHEEGKLMKSDGTSYSGSWANGDRDGQGIFTGIGKSYEGQWKNNLRHGLGKSTYYGETYEGNFENDRRSGKGTWIPYEGLKYEGEWVDDKRHGFGTLTNSDGSCYQGHWRYDKKSGLGVMIEANGETFDGNWADNKRHGKGVWTSPTGYSYDGEWKDDKKFGNGIYKSPQGVTYTGEWLNDRKEGLGKANWPNGSSYDGSWKSDIFHGSGTFTYPDGATYKGDWVFGKREGKGIFTTLVGTYDGEWKDGKKEGKGIWKGNDGSSYEGEWKEDRRHNKGVYSAKGINEDQIWREGLNSKPGIKCFPPDLPTPHYF